MQVCAASDTSKRAGAKNKINYRSKIKDLWLEKKTHKRMQMLGGKQK